LQIEQQRRMLTKPPGNIPRQNGGSMSRRRITTISLISASLLIAVSGCLLWATTSSGSTSVLLGRATYKPEHGDVLQVQRVLPPSWSAVIQARPALDVAVQMITFQPNGQSGWHRHPGPVFISVVSGEMTFYESDDPDCKPVVKHAGEGFLDKGEHAHIARNESGATAINVVTYLVPPGAPLRIDEPSPGNCPF
jgi:quercetin dioxygenase-like cupin family protein